MEDLIFERRFTYETQFGMDGQACHVGRLSQAGRYLHRNRCGLLRRAYGTRLVEGRKVLCEAAFQKVNQKVQVGKSRGRENTVSAFYIFRTQVTEKHGKLIS